MLGFFPECHSCALQGAHHVQQLLGVQEGQAKGHVKRNLLAPMLPAQLLLLLVV